MRALFEVRSAVTMVLQAFIDDSGSDPKAHSFMLAGFVAPAEAWAAFADDWQVLLDRAPEAGYLKTAHAYAGYDEFHLAKGWNRNLVTNFMMDASDIIKEHVKERIAVWVRRDYFDKHIKPVPNPYNREPANNPYFLCFYHFILTAAALHSISTPEPCEFFFDEQGSVGERARSWWEAFKHFAAHGSQFDFTPFLGAPPTFEDEKKCKPLQAADFYAWHMNKWVLENRTIYMPRPKPLLRLGNMRFMEEEITEAKLMGLRDSFTVIAKNIAATDPSVTSTSPNRAPKKLRPKWYPTGF
jgi:hypothetical protein